jgi:hypothetical protein
MKYFWLRFTSWQGYLIHTLSNNILSRAASLLCYQPVGRVRRFLFYLCIKIFTKYLYIPSEILKNYMAAYFYIIIPELKWSTLMPKVLSQIKPTSVNSSSSYYVFAFIRFNLSPPCFYRLSQCGKYTAFDAEKHSI